MIGVGLVFYSFSEYGSFLGFCVGVLLLGGGSLGLLEIGRVGGARHVGRAEGAVATVGVLLVGIFVLLILSLR